MQMPDYLRKRSKIDLVTDCIVFTNKLGRDGYGIVGQRALLYKQTKENSVHRISWVINRGPIPYGLCVLHKCDNRGCFNVDHLWLGTRDDNNKDRATKKRNAYQKGQYSPKAKLTDENVLLIRNLQGFITAADLGRALNLNLSTICNIWNRKSWSHI